jgi:hypothetical protein
MDFLIRLNAYGPRVKDILRKTIYLQGEGQSQIKGVRYVLNVSPMLIRSFFWSLVKKYIFQRFPSGCVFLVPGVDPFFHWYLDGPIVDLL